MALEATATYINSLVITNPDGLDARSTVAAHLRLIKGALKRTFPNVTSPVTVTQGWLNTVVFLRTDVALTCSASQPFTAKPTFISVGNASKEVPLLYGYAGAWDLSGTLISLVTGFTVTNSSLGVYTVDTVGAGFDVHASTSYAPVYFVTPMYPGVIAYVSSQKSKSFVVTTKDFLGAAVASPINFAMVFPV